MIRIFILVTLIAGVKPGASQIIADSSFIEQQVSRGIRDAECILEGEVIGVESYFAPDSSKIYSSNSIRIIIVWKNGTLDDLQTGDTIKVITLGGRVGNENISISHQIGFSKGQIGMFFCSFSKYPLNPNRQTEKRSFNLYDGIYFDYDYTPSYPIATYNKIKYVCLDSLYNRIDPDFEIDCLNVYPNGKLQREKYLELEKVIREKQSRIRN